MRWTVHGERVIYDSEWVRLSLVDVEVPGGRRFDHHVIRSVRGAAGVVVTNDAAEVLLLWRHRFITDTWGWEIEHVTPLVTYHPLNGISDQTFCLFLARGAVYRHEPTDPSESERVEWVPLDHVRDAIAAGEFRDGLSLTALTYALATGAIGG